MQVLLIGGTALIGPHVIRELRENQANEVHTLTRGGKRYFCEQSHVGERRDLATLHRTIEVIKPDVVEYELSWVSQTTTPLKKGCQIPLRFMPISGWVPNIRSTINAYP